MFRIQSISLLIALIAPLFLAIGWVKLDLVTHQKKVKKEIKEGIESSERITELTFSLEETKTKLNWEHDREFEFQGQMYDILESHTEGDSITYKVYIDHEETKMKGLLSKLLKRGFGEEEEDASVQKIDFLLFFQFAQIKEKAKNHIYLNSNSSTKNSIYQSPFLGTSCPPPDHWV